MKKATARIFTMNVFIFIGSPKSAIDMNTLSSYMEHFYTLY